MNKKLLLYIFAILMAFTLTFSCVSAADDGALQADNSVVQADDGALQTQENSVQSQEDPVQLQAQAQANGSADLAVAIESMEIEDEIIWGISVANRGPDAAINTAVLTYGSDNLFMLDYIQSTGIFDPITGIWEVGDLAPGDYAILLIDTLKVGPGPYYVEALALSDTPDPNYNNNYAIAYVGLNHVSAAQETLPATGNPFVVALLALMVIGIGGLKRRF